jgi:hypothetical protein
VDAPGEMRVKRHHIKEEACGTIGARCPRQEIDLLDDTLLFTEKPGILVRVLLPPKLEQEGEQIFSYSPDTHILP